MTDRPISPTMRRALGLLASGDMDLRSFARAMWPDADHERVSSIGRDRGGRVVGCQMMRVAASYLSRVVGAGYAYKYGVGERSATRIRWALTKAGRREVRGER